MMMAEEAPFVCAGAAVKEAWCMASPPPPFPPTTTTLPSNAEENIANDDDECEENEDWICCQHKNQ
jgi:hypothetical protein